MLCQIQLILILGASAIISASRNIEYPSHKQNPTASNSSTSTSARPVHGRAAFKQAEKLDSHTKSNRHFNISKLIEFKEPVHVPSTVKQASNVTTKDVTEDRNLKDRNESMVASASLLRPSFMRGLLAKKGSQVKQQHQQEQAEEEEEVTQTIMVPADSTQAEKESQIEQMVEQNAPGSSIKMVKVEDDQQEEVRASQSPRNWASSRPNLVRLPGSSLAAVEIPEGRPNILSSQITSLPFQPKAEASLQLTSTEMSSLLNDREAPDFYREREVNGDGVLVGEEPARLGMAASGHFGSHNSGPYYGHSPAEVPSHMGGGHFGAEHGSGFDSGNGDSAAALYAANQQRLHQAASEEADYGRAMSANSAFNHRFGHGFGGADVDNMNGYGGEGRLMQSPNEFTETSSFGGGGGGAPFDGRSNLYGDNAGYAGSTGYPNSPALDRHASELYGAGGMGSPMGNGGGFGAGPTGAFGGSDLFAGRFYNGGRLGQAASHNPYSQSDAGDFVDPRLANQMGSGGQFNEHRNDFGASNALMSSHHGGHLHAHQHHQGFLSGQASSSLQSNDMPSSNRLMPLSPVVPQPDDLYSPKEASSNQQESSSSSSPPFASSMAGRQHHQYPPHLASSMNRYGPRTHSHRQQPQVHEAIEDDPTDVSQADEQGSTSTPSYAQDQHQEHHQLQQRPPIQEQQPFTTTESVDSETYATTTMSSAGESGQHPQPTEVYQDRSSGGNRPELPINLVLNVPPPTNVDQNSGLNNLVGHRGHPPRMVEFSRVGSAGYLGPQGMDRRFIKKSSLQRNTNRNPAENPAHAGKYIID